MVPDPDSNEARLAAHRRAHALPPEGHEPPKPAALEAAEERLRLAALEVCAALEYVDKIHAAPRRGVSYETMQRSGFRRPDGWARKYTLADARSHAECAALALRRAWNVLDPTS